MHANSLVFARGAPTPIIVDSLERAKELAFKDVLRSGARQPVLLIALDHPEQSAEILGYVEPDGTYTALPACRPVPSARRAVSSVGRAVSSDDRAVTSGTSGGMVGE